MRASAGLTLLEILIVLALVAAVGAVGLRAGRPSGGRQAASAVRSLLVWGHLQALWSGVDVAVVPVPGGMVARAADGGDACAGGRRLRTLAWSTFAGVRPQVELRAGIVWRAVGGALSCAGGGVISGSVVLADARRRYRIVVSSLGRVRVERLP